MTYDEALEYIHGISWTFCKPGLERIRELCDALGNPERRLKFVHVAGTNGKGSFCSMLSSVLIESGLNVGLYTSPYILRFNERMRINGVPVHDGELAEITAEVKPIADGMKDKPTEFELITAIAFLYFARAGVDVVVLECGMGGRLDSTNVIDAPLLSVITGIALDHTAFLGETVEEIAKEKAGIIKSSSPVLWGGEDERAERVISDTAQMLGCELYSTDYSRLEVTSAQLDGSRFNYKERTDIHIPLLGLYQPKNASLVLEVADILKSTFPSITEQAIRSALAKAQWPARFEKLCDSPLVIFDGAHNPQGIASARKSISHYFGQSGVVALTGVLRDKDYRAIAKDISEVASHAVTITPDSPRALGADEYCDVLSSFGVVAKPCSGVDEALKEGVRLARELCKPLLCLGSLYTYTDVIGGLSTLGLI